MRLVSVLAGEAARGCKDVIGRRRVACGVMRAHLRGDRRPGTTFTALPRHHVHKQPINRSTSTISDLGAFHGEGKLACSPRTPIHGVYLS